MLTNFKKQTPLFKMVMSAMLSAIAVVLVYFVRFPIFPSAAFLEFDMADVPALFGAITLGLPYGFAILFVASLIQALTVSAASGWVGFVMHIMASGVLIFAAGFIYNKFGKSMRSLLMGLIAGSFAMVMIMIPLNLFFTGYVFLANVELVKNMLLFPIIPFNAIKAAANSALAYIVIIPLVTALKKHK